MKKSVFKCMILIACLIQAAYVPAGADTEPPQVDSTPNPFERVPEKETPDISERQPESTLPGGLELVPLKDIHPTLGEVPGTLLGEIIADLAGATGAKRDSIKLVRAEAVVWHDGSLGCPKPGEFYIQVLMSGYWVILEVAEQEYDYRANDSGISSYARGKEYHPCLHVTREWISRTP